MKKVLVAALVLSLSSSSFAQKANPRNPPIQKPDGTWVHPEDVLPAPLTPIQECRKELREGLAGCKVFTDPEDRAACRQAEVEGYKICRSKVPQPPLEFDEDFLNFGLVVIHAVPGQSIDVWMLDEIDRCTAVRTIETSPGFYEADLMIIDEFGTDSVLVGVSDDSATFCELISM